MTYETEWDQMVHELNEALDIESNASHTQRLVTIVNLRSQALKAAETSGELAEVIRQRDKAERRLTRLMTAHTLFAGHIVEYAKALSDVVETFHGELTDRIDPTEIEDAFDLALANLRAKRDTGERHDLSEVEEELGEDPAVTEGLAPLRARLRDDDSSDPDPLGLVDTERKPEIRMDFPGPKDEKVSGETTTDFVDARNRVPFDDADLPLAEDTRAWMADTAAGSARDAD